MPFTTSVVVPVKNDVIEQLYAHAMEGLDVGKAMSQPERAFNVRHLKMGVRLAGALLQCDDEVAMGLLVSAATILSHQRSSISLRFSPIQRRDVQWRLFDLFESQYMSATIKLQVVRALDSSTRRAVGMRYFVDTKAPTETCYQRLVTILTSKQVTRARSLLLPMK